MESKSDAINADAILAQMGEAPKALSSEAVQLARKYHELREKIRALAAQEKDLEAEKDMISIELTAKMQELHMQKFNLSGIGTFYLQNSFYPAIIKAEELIVWLDNHKQGNLAPRTVNKPALKEYWKEAMENDYPVPPPDIAEAHTITDVRLRGEKTKEKIS